LLPRLLSRFTVCAGLIALLLLAPRAGQAQTATEGDGVETARALFNQGLEYSDAGRWQEAADRFSRAYALKPTASIAYNLAQAYIRLGYLAGGSQLLRRSADDPEATPEVREAARTRLRQVTPRLGRLTVQLPREPGAFAYLDGRPLESSRIGVTMEVDPGPHLVQARFGDATSSRRITLAEGAESTVVLSPPAPPVPPPRTSSPGLLRRGWFWVAVASVAAGTAVALSVSHGGSNEVAGNVGTWHVDR
jgi:hypothetical protein